MLIFAIVDGICLSSWESRRILNFMSHLNEGVNFPPHSTGVLPKVNLDWTSCPSAESSALVSVHLLLKILLHVTPKSFANHSRSLFLITLLTGTIYLCKPGCITSKKYIYLYQISSLLSLIQGKQSRISIEQCMNITSIEHVWTLTSLIPSGMNIDFNKPQWYEH